MRRLVLLAAFLCLAAACRNDHAPLSPAKMEAVLLDVQVAEVYSSMVPRDSIKGESKNTDSLAAWYRSIFQHHGVTREEFDQSVNWYRNHPEELDSVYTHVMHRLEQTKSPLPARAGIR